MTPDNAPYVIGDRVRYTASGFKATQPPSRDVVGIVREVEPYGVLVEWPMGWAYEDLNHVEHVR